MRLEEMLLVSLSSPLLDTELPLVRVASPASFLREMGMVYKCGTGVVGNRKKKSIAFKSEFIKLRLHVTCIYTEGNFRTQRRYKHDYAITFANTKHDVKTTSFVDT